MNIGGLQKLTLLDYPGKTACTVFLSGCNFRCPFCHNSGLLGPKVSSISEEQFFSFLKKRQNMLEGVCVSGGEPTLSPDLIPFLNKIKSMGFCIKLDTNGSNPEILAEIIQKNLIDASAIDFKNTPQRYAQTIGLPTAPVDAILSSIDLLKRSGVPYTLRTTVVNEFHSDDDIKEIGEILQGTQSFFLQPFKMSPGIQAQHLTTPSPKQMERWLELIKKYIPAAQIRG